MKKVKQIVKQNIRESSRINQKTVKSREVSYKIGAGEGIRTLDVLLGKQALCR